MPSPGLLAENRRTVYLKATPSLVVAWRRRVSAQHRESRNDINGKATRSATGQDFPIAKRSSAQCTARCRRYMV